METENGLSFLQMLLSFCLLGVYEEAWWSIGVYCVFSIPLPAGSGQQKNERGLGTHLQSEWENA